MQFGVLGTLEVVTGDPPAPLHVPGALERALLGRLLVRPGAVVTVDRLLDDLWSGFPPPTARKSLQVHVVRLRSILEPGRPKGSPGQYVVRRGDGYALAVAPEDVDAGRAKVLAASGRAAWSADDPARARELLRRAEALWRGVPFVDWQDAGWVRSARESLTSLRRTVLEARLDADLALGQHQAVTDELEGLVASDPLAEGWATRLMVALYRSDRQADALAVGRRARSLLVDEMGLEAGPGLRRVEEAILVQSPELDLAIPRPRVPAGFPTGAKRPGCPYLGLASYGTEDEDVFHGRAAAVRALVGRTRSAGLVVVSGSSGAGKSSLVRAGLLPALARGALPGSGSWRSVVLVPGHRPVDDLAPLLTSDPTPGDPSPPVVLVVDQMEEVWGAGVPPAERQAFMDALLALLDDGVCALLVLVIRGDHLGRLGEHAALTARAAEGIVLVPPLTEPEVREVVEGPARTCGLVVDPDLVDAVLRDVHGQAAALPLLSSALVQTWERRREGELTLAGYLQAGGVVGALAGTAEEALGGLDEDARAVARPLLLRLAATSTTGQVVRRRVPLSELGMDGEAGVLRRQVVEAFVSRRLLSIDQDSLDVTHEALLTGWPRLVHWLTEDAAARAVRTHLAPEARAWDAAGRPDDTLYRGARLAAAQEWATRPDGDLTAVERDFVQDSVARGEAELEEARTQVRRERAARRRIRRLAVVLAITVVATLGAGTMAVQGRREADLNAVAAQQNAVAAQQSAVRADANRLAAASVNASSLDLSMLLAAQAYRTSATSQTEDGLLAAVVGRRQVSGVYPTYGLARRIALGDQGRTLYAHGEGKVFAWDLLTRRREVLDSYDSDEAFPTDVDVARTVAGRSETGAGTGDTVAVIRPREAGAASSTLRLLDPDGSTRWVLGEAELGGWPVVAEFTLAGTELVVDTVREYGGGRPVGQLVVVDTVDGSSRPLGPAAPFSPTAYYDPWVKGVSEDGATSLSATLAADGEGHDVGTVDVATGLVTPLDPGERDTLGASFVPVQGGVVELAEDASVHWYPAGSTTSTQRLSSHVSRVTAAATDASGRVLVTGGTDRRVVVHDLVEGEWVVREVLAGHTGSIREVAVSPDGLRAFSTGEDRTVIEWDLSDALRFGTVVPRLQDPVSGVFSIFTGQAVPAGAGALLAPAMSITSSGPDGELWGYALFLDDDSPHAVREWVRVGTRPVVSIPFSTAATSPDGSQVAVTAQFSTTVLRTETRDVVEHVELDEVDGGRYGYEGRVPEPVSPVTWNRDGTQLLIGTGGEGRTGADIPGAVVVVDAGSWEEVDRTREGTAVTALTTSPDGRWLGIGDFAGRVAVADAQTYEVVHELRARGPVTALAFSGDGTRLAAVGGSKALQVWDPATGEDLLTEPQLFGGAGTSVAWLPDDRTVVYGGDDGRAVLFDTVEQRVRGVPLPVLRDGGDGVVHVTPPVEGSDQLTLLPGFRPGRAVREGMVYPLDVGAWLGHACGVAARDLTEQEWRTYLPDRPYQRTCSTLERPSTP